MHQRIAQIKNVKTVNNCDRTSLGTRKKNKATDSTWTPTDKRGSCHDEKRPGEFLVLFHWN